MQNTEKLKLYFIVGEASGDLHAANLMKALREEDEHIDFRFWGGDLMAEVAGKPVKHIKELAFMGFVEVLMNLRTILKNITVCKEDILAYKPDALVLVDYPGFNLRIAEWAKKQGIKVYYYISPQVWAWKQSRVHKIKRDVDHLFAILPFEKDFYAKWGMKVEYVGHPLLDAIEQYRTTQQNTDTFRAKHGLDQRPIIAVLPGSRKQEVKVKLPIMLEALKDFSAYQIIVAGAPSLDASFYQPLMKSHAQVIHHETYDVLSAAEFAVVTSGTATLETALLNIPEVVCYKGSAISYHIAKRLIQIKFISLVNLIMDREVVKELIQHECNPLEIRKEALLIQEGGQKRNAMLTAYAELQQTLGGGGASKKVAQSLLKTIR
jgi:lipid-A-disaccharide synthase